MNSNNSPYKYGFPYKPYDIQIDLMDKIYETLENEQIGIFSSPTGTGKSLSLICSTFTWLQDFKQKKRCLVKKNLETLNKKLADIDKENSSDWIAQHRRKTEIEDQKVSWIELNKKFEKFDFRSQELKLLRQTYVKKKQPFGSNKKRKTDDISESVESIKHEEDENLISYDSDAGDELPGVKEEEDNYVRPKLIYCSRTHSQLTQFISEIQKTEFKENKIRLLALGSRLNLCVNSQVNRSKNLGIINDKCLDLQRKGKQSCIFKKQNEIKNLRDELLSNIMDIEDAHEAGKQLKCCPYYAGRYAIEEAEVLVVPYNILLHEKTRNSMNLRLDESVVIVDEAHNLLDTISSIYSVEIKGGQLMDCLTQLTQYQLRYNTRLNAKNMMHIKQLIMILNSLIKYIQRLEQSKVLTVVDLDLECGIENFNLFNIIDFCEKTQLQRKLFGFVLNKANQVNVAENCRVQTGASGTLSFLERMKNAKKTVTVNKTKKGSKTASKQQVQSDENKVQKIVEEPARPTSVLYQIVEFFKSLTNEIEDGRIIVTVDKTSVRNSSLKFILLNPAKRFDDILKQSRSVILIGGTMEPINQFTDTLFAFNCSKSINQFACDHVIPDQNLYVAALTGGPSKTKFDFSYQQRSNNQVFTELGELLLRVCNIVRGGVVVFFVSYDFEDKIYQFFKSNKFIDRFEKQGKKVYREPRNASDVVQVLANYSESVHQGMAANIDRQVKRTGAILFSVVGGKMSEGINFNDDLGRCVVMVGLPYANIKSIELKEKMNYIEKQSAKDGRKASNAYYENLCMKAVKQSIGRAIRHQRDYASILMIDHRFVTKGSVVDALPDWIKKRYRAYENFDEFKSGLELFFANKSSSKSFFCMTIGIASVSKAK